MYISEENKFIKYAHIGSYDEKYRPQFHYSPAENWMNDPNGLVYYEGEYHLSINIRLIPPVLISHACIGAMQ